MNDDAMAKHFSEILELLPEGLSETEKAEAQRIRGNLKNLSGVEQDPQKEKEAKKETKNAPQAPAGARTSGAVRRIAEKKGNPGQGKPGSVKRAKGPAEGRSKTQREHKPRVTGKRGN